MNRPRSGWQGSSEAIMRRAEVEASSAATGTADMAANREIASIGQTERK